MRICNCCHSIFIGPKKKFWPKTILGTQIFSDTILFSDPTFFWSHHLLELRFFAWTQNFVGPKIMLIQMIFDTKFTWTEQFFGTKIFWHKIFLDPKLFWTKNVLDQKFVWTKILLDQNFFRPNIFLDQTFFWTQTFFGTKIFLDQILFICTWEWSFTLALAQLVLGLYVHF